MPSSNSTNIDDDNDAVASCTFNIVNTNDRLPNNDIPHPFNLQGTPGFVKYQQQFNAALMAVRDLAFKSDLTLDTLNQFLNSLKTLCVSGGNGQLILGCFAECSCCSSGNFDRFETQRRQALEKRIFQDALASNPKDKTLTYLSVGSGSLLQDLIIFLKFVVHGYKKLDITLLDYQYESFNDQAVKNVAIQDQIKFIIEEDSLLVFFTLVKNIQTVFGLEVNIQASKSIAQCLKEQTKNFDLIFAIDYDRFGQESEDYAELCALQKRLKKSGHLYLAFDSFNFYFNDQGCSSIEFEEGRNSKRNYLVYNALNHPVLQQAVSKISNQVLCFIDTLTTFYEHLPYLVSKASKDLHLILVGKELKPEAAECFAEYLNLFTKNDVNISLTVLTQLEKIENSYSCIWGMTLEHAKNLATLISSKADTKSSELYSEENFANINQFFSKAFIAWINPLNFKMGFFHQGQFYAFNTTENLEAMKEYKDKDQAIILDRPDYYERRLKTLAAYHTMRSNELSPLAYRFGIFSKLLGGKPKAEKLEAVTDMIEQIKCESPAYFDYRNRKLVQNFSQGRLKEIGTDLLTSGVALLIRT